MRCGRPRSRRDTRPRPRDAPDSPPPDARTPRATPVHAIIQIIQPVRSKPRWPAIDEQGRQGTHTDLALAAVLAVQLVHADVAALGQSRQSDLDQRLLACTNQTKPKRVQTANQHCGYAVNAQG